MTCMLMEKQLQSHIQIMNRLSSNSENTKKLFQTRSNKKHGLIRKSVLDKAKKYYFDSVFVAYKSDIKKTWQVISKTLSRNKKSHEMKDMS